METVGQYTMPTEAQERPRLIAPLLHEACDRKQCRDCHEWLPLTEFYFIDKAAGTRASYCKACNKARVRAIRKNIRALGPKPNLNRVAAAWIRTS